MSVLTFANQKGGVGKTTSAICLAQELKSRGKRVLFIDTDSQCNSSRFYGAKTEDEATVYDILCGDTPASECIQHTTKGDIIPSDPLMRDAETTVKIDERRFTHLRRSCRDVKDAYDYIIIDTPPEIGVALKNALSMTDYIIVPVQESGWSLDGLMDFSDAVDLARDANPDLKIAGILTVMAKQRTKKSQRMSGLADQIAEKLHTKHFTTKIRESVACAEALTEYYVPLGEYAPHGTTYEDYKAFTDELLGEIEHG